MDRKTVYQEILTLFESVPGNTIPFGKGALTMFDAPLMGIAAAEDPLFEEFRRAEVIGAEFRSPAEWLGSAKSVVSLFFPFSEEVRASNRGEPEETSLQWLYGRVEGQEYLNAFMTALRDRFLDLGAEACVPAMALETHAVMGAAEGGGLHIVSNWSERHAAYACGLGTFGISRGLITEKGMAGRFASVILSLPLEADVRPYSGIYDYCIRCGACIGRCPVKAISLEDCKDNAACQKWVEQGRLRYAPRYGCGKCQTGVPCEFTNPSKR